MKELDKALILALLRKIEASMDVTFIGNVAFDKDLYKRYNLKPVMESIEEIREILNQTN